MTNKLENYLFLDDIRIWPKENPEKSPGPGYQSNVKVSILPGVRFSTCPNEHKSLEKALAHINNLYGDKGAETYSDKILIRISPKFSDLENARDPKNPYRIVLKDASSAASSGSPTENSSRKPVYSIYDVRQRSVERALRQIVSALGERRFTDGHLFEICLGIELNLPKLVKEYAKTQLETKIEQTLKEINQAMLGEINSLRINE